MHGSDDNRLDALFQAFRASCPGREPAPNFMPELWQRIESRQRYTFSFHRMADAFVTAALVFCIAATVYLHFPHATPASYSSQSYLEALSDANSLDTPEIVGSVRLDLSAQGR